MAVATREIWLIRHGATEWSKTGQHTGHTDLPLLPEGEADAQALGRRLADHEFALVLTSPLKRAYDTCRLAGFGGVAEIEPLLREWDYGEYEGRRTADIREERPGWLLWRDGVPGGESLESVAERARKVIDRASAARGDVALFAHGHVLRILTACWLGLLPDAGRLFALAAGAISILGYEHETRVIESWNVTVR
jgi:broad specificity phosphatase PhoE